MNNIFISSHSFSIKSDSSLEDLDESIDKLKDLISSCSNYDNIVINNDILDYKFGNGTLDDILYEISEMRDDIYQIYLNDIERTISKYKSNISTIELMSFIDDAPCFNGDFASVYYQDLPWPDIDSNLQIRNHTETYQLNCNNLSKHPISNENFTKRAQQLFHNVKFHDDFKNTLLTVKSGDFKAYSIEFTRAIHALHNAVPNFTFTGHNPPDLKRIRHETFLLGRTMDCTPQGKNKTDLYYNFSYIDEADSVRKNINVSCEYHLKVNFDNTGKKIHRELFNRAYFGLPMINGKKCIFLAFLGKHYNED
jgi:hypothetical protein